MGVTLSQYSGWQNRPHFATLASFHWAPLYPTLSASPGWQISPHYVALCTSCGSRGIPTTVTAFHPFRSASYLICIYIPLRRVRIYRKVLSRTPTSIALLPHFFYLLSSLFFLLSSLFSLSLVAPLVVLSDSARLGGLCCCGLCARSSSNKGRTQLTGFYRKPWGDTVRSRALPLTSLRCRIAGLKRLSSRLEQTCAAGRNPFKPQAQAQVILSVVHSCGPLQYAPQVVQKEDCF